MHIQQTHVRKNNYTTQPASSSSQQSALMHGHGSTSSRDNLYQAAAAAAAQQQSKQLQKGKQGVDKVTNRTTGSRHRSFTSQTLNSHQAATTGNLNM